MNVRLILDKSLYLCNVLITDVMGTQSFCLDATDEDNLQNKFVDVNVFSNEFDLTLTPVLADYNSVFNDIQQNSWKDKIVNKTAKFLVSSMDKMLLRVGCKYHIENLQEGAILSISGQEYVFGTFDPFEILELFPMMYMFYEVTYFGNRFELTNSFATNRKEVVRTAKKAAATDFLGYSFIMGLFTYPFQVSRVKRLSKNKKIFKVLKNFNSMSEAERQRMLDKKEKL